MIPCQRHLFDLPDDIAYLNCAYLSPLMKAVMQAGQQGARLEARPWEVTPRDFFTTTEIARELFARVINASANDIAIVPAASYGVAVAARNVPLKRGQTIVLLEDQFPSNVYTWRERAKEAGAHIATVRRPSNADWTEATASQITEQTAVVALPNCHWTDGGLLDLSAISNMCRQTGAAMVLDITQSAGAMPFDVQQVHPDFLVAAGYKWLLGPYSLGFLYVAPKWQQGEPLEQNWIAREGSENFAGLVNYRDEFQPGARRFDMGERANFQLLPMAVAALRQILDWRVEEIALTLAHKTATIWSPFCVPV
jgi:selenocysteine lyase/cysteine desulfurase